MKISKIIKRSFTFLLFIVILIVGVAVAVPYFFKDEILAKIKEEANNTLDATVDFSDVNLSLLRNFPNFSFAMEDLKVTGKNEFDGIPLVQADDIDFTLDLMSVIKSDRPIEIETITLNAPEVNILILNNGKANYDIVKPSEEETETGEYDFLIQLEKYQINDGSFTYDDRAGSIFLELKNLDHQGKGDFTQDVFDLVTKTSVKSLSASSGGINYLRKANTKLDATFNIDLPSSTYTLAENDLRINSLKLLVDGFVQMKENDDIKIDFTFDAPKNDFKNLLSLIPSAFTSDFDNVKADGKMAFNGYVKGIYNGAKEKLPAFKVDLDIDEGSFKYPDLPMGMDNIFAKINIESPSSDLDKMKINIPNFKLALDGKPFEGRFNLSTPISDPNIDTKLKGTLDLANINKAFPMEGVSEMSGIIDADILIDTRLSTIEKEDYENADVNGKANVTNLTYVAEGLPKIVIKETQIDFTPKHATLNSFSGKLGKSDIEASGKINNILAYFSPKKTMTGDVKVRSKYFNLDEWMTEEEATTVPSGEVAEVEIFDRFNFNIDAKVGQIDYDVYKLNNSSVTGSFSSNELIINDFETKLGESDLSGKGNLTNIFNYVFKNEVLGGDLAINSDFFDLNPFMEETETAGAKKIANETEVYEPIIIPDNIAVNVDAKIKKLVYTNLDLKDFSGKLDIKNSKVQMKDLSARTLGGKFEADGFYDTKDAEKPKYKLTYDIKAFDFKNSFQKFITIQKLAPIANYIQGNFSSRMSFEGILGEDFIPDFNSLNADGFLQTTNGIIKDFKPIKKIGEALNISKLKNHRINLKGTKNWFEVKDGHVTVKEFPIKYQGIDMVMGGSHGIEQDINYMIKAKIPSKMIDQNAVGSAAKKGIDLLNQQASKLGLNINAGEFINVNINLTGSIADPQVKFNLVGSEGQSIKDVVTTKINEVKETAVEEIKEVVEDKKEELNAKVEARKAALQKEANTRIEKLQSAAEKSAARVRAEGKKSAEKVRAEGYKQADALVDAAGNNPIKKRAAKIAANKLKKETDKKADQVNAKADQSASKITTEAEQKAMQIRNEYQKKIDKVSVDNI